jgi:ABC-2 type transport system ATP-binding protein
MTANTQLHTGPRTPTPTDGRPSDPGVELALSTDRLTKDYRGVGLFDVSMRVPTGSVYGLVGPNGAGKTTLLSIVTGMRKADSGTVAIAAPRQRVAVCPDVPEFDGWLTAYEVVDLARSYVAPRLAGDEVRHALTVAGLGDAARRRVGGFSRGMTQRLGLAAALVGHPQLLLLDEPTSALDPAGRAEILALVASLRGRVTVVFSSHILADVERVADRVGVLREGRLIYQGSTQALIDGHLQPRWQLRLASDPHTVVERLRGEPWVTHVEQRADSLVVEATTLEAGEQGIPAAIAASGGRLVACEPLAADLEAAFLALTGDPR